MKTTRKRQRPQVRVYPKGTKVAILNRTMGGKLILEGYARVVEWDEFDGSHLVHFIGKDGKLDEHGPVRRFIDDSIQADPENAVLEMQIREHQ